MFDLFGAEMPLAVRFFLAFLIVLGLIGAAAWAVRRFGSTRLGGTVRGRQPRLAVIEYATVDARRRLLLVRRDNVEHLMMIGGPSDVVVESNIVRAMPALREPAMPRVPTPADTLSSRALPEVGSNGSWPLQPEPPAPAIPPSMPASIPPAMPPRRPPRVEPIVEEPMLAPPPSEPPRPQREVLSALADDLAAHTPPPITPLSPRNRPPAPPRMAPADVRAEQPPRMPPAPPAAEPTAVDQNLAEMAQRLEAALRKPKAAEARAPIAPAQPSDDEEIAEAPAEPPPPPPLRAARPAEAKPARAEPKAKEGKALYDTLEQEMASLLGRPASKN
jgi:flagellar protein FliO/FliZ